MPDTKLDEAIALATAILEDPKQWAYGDSVKSLARALLDATAPGAQYRAGMEAAAALCDSRAEFGRELERDGATSRDSPNWPVIEAESLARDIRAAIAALPASPEPAPVAMPEIRWEGDYEDGDIELCLLGDFHVGTITHYQRPNTWGFELQLVHAVAVFGSRHTKEEARAAVEATVRERLNMRRSP